MPPDKNSIGAGFTEGELKFAGFWVRNRLLIRKVAYGVLIGLNVIFWGYTLWTVIDAYAISYPRESRITQEIAENQILLRRLQSNQPRGIQTKTVSVFQGTEDRMDVVVPIQNPNEQWYAEFTYRFNVSGELTPKRSGFILPGQERYLGEFGFVPETGGARTAALTVDNIRWKRVDPEVVGSSYEEWISRRDAFEVSNVTFTKDVRAGRQVMPRTSFTFRNPTAYGYWNVGIYIVLLRGTAPVAANYITLTNVRPGDARTVNVDWFEDIPAISETRVDPVVNFFDESVYLPTTQFE